VARKKAGGEKEEFSFNLVFRGKGGQIENKKERRCTFFLS